ncbi:MAG: hypothetical protein ACRDTD_31475 [Pseudonocardiaceae bacterium]
MTDDVEKRWRNPTEFRRAVLYGGSVIGVALAVMAIVLVVAATASERTESQVCTKFMKHRPEITSSMHIVELTFETP